MNPSSFFWMNRQEESTIAFHWNQPRRHEGFGIVVGSTSCEPRTQHANHFI
jgi:hypothetical protein